MTLSVGWGANSGKGHNRAFTVISIGKKLSSNMHILLVTNIAISVQSACLIGDSTQQRQEKRNIAINT